MCPKTNGKLQPAWGNDCGGDSGSGDVGRAHSDRGGDKEQRCPPKAIASAEDIGEKRCSMHILLYRVGSEGSQLKIWLGFPDCAS